MKKIESFIDPQGNEFILIRNGENEITVCSKEVYEAQQLKQPTEILLP